MFDNLEKKNVVPKKCLIANIELILVIRIQYVHVLWMSDVFSLLKLLYHYFSVIVLMSVFYNETHTYIKYLIKYYFQGKRFLLKY